jgi:hypothetical protein
MPDIIEPATAGPRAMPEIEAAIDRWFNTHIAGSPVARSVEAYNHLRAVLGHLAAEISTVTQEI